METQKPNPTSQSISQMPTKEREVIQAYVEGVKDTASQFFLYSGSGIDGLLHYVPFLQYIAFVLKHYEHIALTKEQIADPHYYAEYYTVNGVNLKKFL